jgi:hypothetical protein
MINACRKIKILDTLYVFGEGETEAAFLKFLKINYSKGHNINVQIKNLGGKNPAEMIDKAIRIIKGSNFDKKLILLDSDKEIPNEQIQKAKKYELYIIKAVPCIEGLFFEILGYCRDTVKMMESEKCKNDFEKKYLDAKQKLNYRDYNKIFNKDLLDNKKESIEELNILIGYMSNAKNHLSTKKMKL